MRIFILAGETVHALTPGTATIGSDATDAIQLREPAVRSSHLSLKSDSAGRWSVLNLSERVEVNGTGLAKNETRVIVTPARIRVGTQMLELRDAKGSILGTLNGVAWPERLKSAIMEARHARVSNDAALAQIQARK